MSLKKELDDLRLDAEIEITKILQDFAYKSGYVPLVINVNVTDVSKIVDAEKTYFVNKIDLSYGQ